MASIEIVNGPLELYWAPVGEAMPNVDAAPAGNWALIGTSGDDNYHEDGVIIDLEQTMEVFRPLGSTIAKCVFRTEQDIRVRVTMVDLNLTELRVALNLNAVTTDAGPPSVSQVNLDYGIPVDDMALLCRGTGNSSEFATGNLQFELNRVVEVASHELAFVKGEPVGVELEFQALQDDSGNVGQITVQNA